MQIDVSFTNAKVYDVWKIDVVLGQKFLLTSDYTGVSDWFADADAVLSVDQQVNNAQCEATGLGTSTILIMDAALANQLKKLVIRVVDAIVEPIKNLNISADKAVSKP